MKKDAEFEPGRAVFLLTSVTQKASRVAVSLSKGEFSSTIVVRIE